MYKINKTKDQRRSVSLDDPFRGIPHTDLSQKEELKFIKLSKLSFYDDASLEERTRYAECFMEYEPWFKEIMSSNASEKEKEDALNRAIEISRNYREQFVENNTKLVLWVANKYYGRSSIPKADLFQEGVIGLMTAMEKFDISKKNKFSTYATTWIWQSMQRYVRSSRTIRVPVNVWNDINNVYRKMAELTNILDRTPSIKEVAQYMKKPEAEVRRLLDCTTSIASLDSPVGNDDDETTLGYFIEDKEARYEDGVLDEITEEDLKRVILDADDLTWRDKEIILRRYGFLGEPETMEDIAESFNVSRQRAQQLEQRSLCKLKRNAIVNKLHSELKH